METMKAVRIHAYSGPEVLRYEEARLPGMEAGDMLVRVHAAGVNPVDWKVRDGRLREHLPHALPLILGWDFSGVIAAVSAGVAGLRPGDEVYSRPDVMRDGAYAEYIAARGSEVALKPKSLDHIHAAAIPLAALTAWQALFDAAGLCAGQKVLIHGAAGGVGCLAVQLAKWKGAHVIGTASKLGQDFLMELGADEAIDYQATRFEEAVRDLDVVMDTIGGDTLQRSWQVLRKGGFLVSIAALPSAEVAATHGVRQAFVVLRPNAIRLAEIAELVDSGKLKPVVETVLPLTEARRAQELSKAGHTHGKIVLRVV